MPKLLPDHVAGSVARPYQQDGIKFLRRQGRALLADEMGLGKSMQLIAAAEGHTLVVAPANVIATDTWTEEIRKWAPNPELFTQAAYTGLPQRGERNKLMDNLEPAFDRHWDTLILDESHYVKNPKSNRTRMIVKLAKQSDRVYLASGTPIPNWPHEIFTSLQLIWPDRARGGGQFGSYWRWVDHWFKTLPSRYSDYGFDIQGLRSCTPACKNLDPLHPCVHYRAFTVQNFDGKFLQRLRDEVLTDLPELTHQEIRVPMGAAQDREYARMKKDYLANTGDEEVIAWSDGAKNTMLDQITTGLGLIAPPYDTRGSAKLDLLRQDLSERFRPTIVVAHYRASVEAAAKVARELGKTVAVMHGEVALGDRAATVRRFQAGEIDVLCGSIETMAEGLTLTAADMMILIETSWKSYRNQQVIRRIHRLGQDRPCTIRDYVSVTAKGNATLDTRKRALVAKKTDAQTRTLTAAMFKELLR